MTLIGRLYDNSVVFITNSLTLTAVVSWYRVVINFLRATSDEFLQNVP